MPYHILGTFVKIDIFKNVLRKKYCDPDLAIRFSKMVTFLDICVKTIMVDGFVIDSIDLINLIFDEKHKDEHIKLELELYPRFNSKDMTISINPSMNWNDIEFQLYWIQYSTNVIPFNFTNTGQYFIGYAVENNAYNLGGKWDETRTIDISDLTNWVNELYQEGKILEKPEMDKLKVLHWR